MNWYKIALKKQELHLVGFMQQDKNGVYDVVKLTQIDGSGIKRIILKNVSPEDFSNLISLNKAKKYQEMKNIIQKYNKIKIASSNAQYIINMQDQMQRKRQNNQITTQQYKQYLQKLLQAKRQVRKNSAGINR